MFITVFPLSYYPLSSVSADPESIAGINRSRVGKILEMLYFYPVIFVSYYIFSLFIRIPVLKYLFTYSTVTHL